MTQQPWKKAKDADHFLTNESWKAVNPPESSETLPEKGAGREQILPKAGLAENLRRTDTTTRTEKGPRRHQLLPGTLHGFLLLFRRSRVNDYVAVARQLLPP